MSNIFCIEKFYDFLLDMLKIKSLRISAEAWAKLP